MKKERKATKEESEKKVDFAKVGEEEVVEEEIKTQEDVAKEFLEGLKNPEKEEESGIDFMGLLNSIDVPALMNSGKKLFKKEKADPNVCEITIKAPSEVVLRLFGV